MGLTHAAVDYPPHGPVGRAIDSRHGYMYCRFKSHVFNIDKNVFFLRNKTNLSLFDQVATPLVSLIKRSSLNDKKMCALFSKKTLVQSEPRYKKMQ